MSKELISEFSEFNGAVAAGSQTAGSIMQANYAAYMRKKDADAKAASTVAKAAASSPYAFMANKPGGSGTPVANKVVTQGSAAATGSASAGQKMQNNYAAYMLKKDADAKAAASPYAFMATKQGISGGTSTSNTKEISGGMPASNTSSQSYQPETGVTVNGQAAPPEVQQMFVPPPKPEYIEYETGVTTNGIPAKPEVQQLFQPAPIPIVASVPMKKHGWLHRFLAKLGLIDE